MNANRIANTIVLVLVIAAIIVGIVESNDTGEFITGLWLGVCFFVAWISWEEDL